VESYKIKLSNVHVVAPWNSTPAEFLDVFVDPREGLAPKILCYLTSVKIFEPDCKLDMYFVINHLHPFQVVVEIAYFTL